MQIAFTEEQNALRQELRSYFAQLMTPDVQEAMASGVGEYGGGELYKRLVSQMGADGWLGIGWPTEYGGLNRSMIDQLIFLEIPNVVVLSHVPRSGGRNLPLEKVGLQRRVLVYVRVPNPESTVVAELWISGEP